MEHQLKIQYYVVYACKDFKKARFHIQHSTFLLFYFLNLVFLIRRNIVFMRTFWVWGGLI